MNLPNITILEYPNLRDDHDYWKADDFLIALYLNKAKGFRLTECMRQVNYYEIEELESIYTVDENQGILTIGRDNFLITAL